MLDKYVGINICFTNAIKSLLGGLIAISPTYGEASVAVFKDAIIDLPQDSEYGWAVKYLTSVNEHTPIEEVADFLVSLRVSMVAKGYEVLPLTSLFSSLHQQLIERGVNFNAEEIQYLYEIIAEKESSMISAANFGEASIITVGAFGPPQLLIPDPKAKKQIEKAYQDYLAAHPKKAERKRNQREKRNEPNSNTVIGFMLILGGTLICLIPFPGAQTVGGAIIGVGASQCALGLNEKSQENAEKQREGALANSPAELHP